MSGPFRFRRGILKYQRIYVQRCTGLYYLNTDHAFDSVLGLQVVMVQLSTSFCFALRCVVKMFCPGRIPHPSDPFAVSDVHSEFEQAVGFNP